MKAIETTRRQDGSSDTTQLSIPLKKENPRVKLNMLAPENEEPIAVYYFETGWNYGYSTYHVIIEYGDFEQTDYLFLSHQQFVKKFGVDPMDDETKRPVHSEFPF
jgi:hypothetical protein